MKKVVTMILAAIAVLLLALSVCATETNDAAQAGEELLNTLLKRQFDAFCTGDAIETDDIFADTESTEMYKEYLRWHLGKIKGTGQYWNKYEYVAAYTETIGDTFVYSGNMDYWRGSSAYPAREGIVRYEISLTNVDGTYLISAITTDTFNFTTFEEQYAAVALERSENASMTDEDVTGTLLARTINAYVSLNSITSPVKDIVDMDANYEAYLAGINAAEDNAVSTNATSYSYNGERGRNYAETYYSTANSCFKEYTNADCTNFVSQCIWAAYGGWTSSDSTATMTTNIANGKRMQSSSSSSNWYGKKTGCGNPWAGVANLWSFVTTTQTTGPQGTGYERGKSSNYYPSSILTGQVLQFRNGSSGSYAHSVYVSGGVNDSFANIKVAQHSSNKILYLDDLITSFGGTNCYMRQIKFTSAKFDS